MSRRKQKSIQVRGMTFNQIELKGILKYLGILVTEMYDYDAVELESFKNEIQNITNLLNETNNT